MAKDLALARYGYGTSSSALNSMFTSTVDRAARTLMVVAATAKAGSIEKWGVKDHVRFMSMLVSWVAVWFFRTLMDYFPTFFGPSSHKRLLDGLPTAGLLDIAPFSSSALVSTSADAAPSLDLILYDGSVKPPVKSLGRALYHALGMLNEIPATSSKYQFAMAMADRIVDENTKDGHADLLEVNRIGLSSAFARTSSLLYLALQSNSRAGYDFPGGAFTLRIINSLPFGFSHVAPHLLKGVNAMVKMIGSSITQVNKPQMRQVAIVGDRRDELEAEKHAQQLLWIANKMRDCGVAGEALVQWSMASGLASLALTSNSRVQGFILKISAILFGEFSRANMELHRQVKYRLLVLWIPLFCYADNGFAYPVLTRYEKAEMEKIINDLISSLPSSDQEVILTNWLQDFTISKSDWPNLQLSYDQWCQSTRDLIIESS